MNTRPVTARDLWALAGGAASLALAWILSDVLLLAFAGVLMALILNRLTSALERRMPISRRWALPLVVVTLLVVTVAFVWLAGAAAAEQLQTLRETLPRAWAALQQWLLAQTGGRRLIEAMQALPKDWSSLAGMASGTFGATVNAIGATALVLVLGIYLTADPHTYCRGALALLPASRRAHAERFFDAARHRLSRWLLGQGVSMAIVGAAMALALWAIGMPLAWTLGAIAGLLEFVPYFGTLASSALIIAVAFSEGERMALWAALVCFGVQQAEAYFVQPLTQRWAVRMPPALGVLSVLIFGLLFDLPGVLLAMPLMVLTQVLVEQSTQHP
jgi:predicted PurR-regulated permease PerM